MTTKTSDPVAVRRGRRRQKALDFRLRQDFREVLGRPEGRRVLQWVIDKARVDEDIVLDGANTYRAIGRRSLGLELREFVAAIHPAVLITMKAELEADPPFLQDDDPEADSDE